MRFVLCVLLAALLPGAASAATRALSFPQAQAAAQKGDQRAASALATTTDRMTCLNACGSRGYSNAKCETACRPGYCHPAAEQPYCIASERR